MCVCVYTCVLVFNLKVSKKGIWKDLDVKERRTATILL